jgi:uncharacterized protein with GYD domain
MLFVTLLSPRGKGVDAVKHLKALKPPKDITIRQVFFTFGRYDGLVIFEAASEAAAMKFVMQTGFDTNYVMETLVAVPTDKI